MTLPRALTGVRVLDFTWVRAGPWATRWLGAFGAEIIKIEWPENLDILRSNRMVIPPGVEPGPNAPGQFADTNVNKRGITLNVRTPRGLEIARRLAAISDIVMENFSSRVMQKWGLGYEDLKKLRPDIIYVSMAGFGHTGRNHHYTTMGPSAQALSGQTFLSGLPGQAAGRLGLVVSGRHRRHVRRHGGPHGAAPSQRYGAGAARRPVADDHGHHAHRCSLSGSHRERAPSTSRGLPARQS